MKTKSKKPTFASLFADARAHPEYWIEGARFEFTEMLRILMIENGITAYRLSKMSGISKANLSKIFNHRPNLTIETMVKLALALDRTVSIRIVLKSVPK